MVLLVGSVLFDWLWFVSEVQAIRGLMLLVMYVCVLENKGAHHREETFSLLVFCSCAQVCLVEV